MNDIIINSELKNYKIEHQERDITTKGAITIGGNNKNKFVPNINLSKWYDEYWFNINYPEIVTIEKEQFGNNKIEFSVKDKLHRYYMLDEGKLEYEIEIAKKPDTNILVLNIDFHPDLRFYFQPDLTLKQIDQGMSRDDENINKSWAIYCPKRNYVIGQKNYMNGKFGHIYRPQLIDDLGEKIWGDIIIDIHAKQMKIIMPQQFLNDAHYPIIVDPIIGSQTEGTTNNVGTDKLSGSVFSAPANGTTDQATLSFFCRRGICKPAVYATSGGWADNQNYLSSNPQEIYPGDTVVWHNMTLTPPAFVNGTYYWIGVLGDNDGSDLQLRSDLVGEGLGKFETGVRTYGDGFPATFPTPSTKDTYYLFCVYITYSETGGGRISRYHDLSGLGGHGQLTFNPLG